MYKHESKFIYFFIDYIFFLCIVYCIVFYFSDISLSYFRAFNNFKHNFLRFKFYLYKLTCNDETTFNKYYISMCLLFHLYPFNLYRLMLEINFYIYFTIAS